MNLHQIDLNLLVLFDALFRHRSVSAAANEICLSQSAFSHGLARLRKRLDDELFTRINNIMEPTEKALLVAAKLSQALPLIHNALNASVDFDPSTSELEFKFVATDYPEFCLLPKLITKVSQLAPHVRISVHPSKDKLPIDHLKNEQFDFALGLRQEMEPSNVISHQTWLTDSYCTIARKDHPALTKGLTLETFLSSSHVLVTPTGENTGVVDQALATRQLKRKITLQLPNVLVAPYTIVHTDLLLTIPRLMAEHLARQIDIDIFTTPIDIPDYQLNLYWHKINAGKASHLWIRQLIDTL